MAWRTLLSGLLLAPLPVQAHDFWIQPDHFRISQGQTATAKFLVGTAKEPEAWVVKRERIVSLTSIGPDGVTDQQATVTTGVNGGAAPRFGKAGTHILAFETTPAEIDLPPEEYNEYLQHEGLTTAIELRATQGKTGTNGRELYARRAKALIQIGKRPTGEATVRLGHTLEIVPVKNPHSLKAGEPLQLAIWFEGKLLPGATVGLERLDDPTFAEARAKSDAAGRVSFTLPRQGSWKVATIWTRPIAANPRADFDTLFASLTFGY